MKKMIMFLLIFFIGIIKMQADNFNWNDFSSIACNYDLTYSVSQMDEKVENIQDVADIGEVQVKIDGYNTDNPTVTIWVQCKDCEKNDKRSGYIKYTGPTNDYKNSDDYAQQLRFFTLDGKSKFVDNFNKTHNCPDLFVNNTENSFDVEFTKLDPLHADTAWKNSVSSTLVSEDGEKFFTLEKYLKNKNNNKNVEPKKPKECSYRTPLQLYNREFNIKLITYYDEASGKESGYAFEFNGNKSEIFHDFSNDVTVNLGTGIDGLMTIPASQLDKMFIKGEDCLDDTKLFDYLDAPLATMGVYKITTDEKEAKDNGLNGEYNQTKKPLPKTRNGQGGKSNTGASLKDPTLTGFGNTGDSCSAVLGTTFSALVKEVIKWVRIAGGIIAIVNGMLKLIPAIMSKDAEALSKAARTCVIMAIILVFCALFPWLLNLIGSIFKWDVSCIV